MKKFISWIVSLGVLTGISSAFASADLVDGVCDECYFLTDVSLLSFINSSDKNLKN